MPVCPGRAPRAVQVLQTVSVHYRAPRRQAIIGQELRARYETPQEVPPEMLRLLTHLDEQAGKESQALNEKQEPEHHAFHVDAAVEHES
jgi:hypothetical protein